MRWQGVILPLLHHPLRLLLQSQSPMTWECPGRVWRCSRSVLGCGGRRGICGKLVCEGQRPQSGVHVTLLPKPPRSSPGIGCGGKGLDGGGGHPLMQPSGRACWVATSRTRQVISVNRGWKEWNTVNYYSLLIFIWGIFVWFFFLLLFFVVWLSTIMNNTVQSSLQYFY